MKLLIESVDFSDCSVITEADTSGNKSLFIMAPFIQTEIVNKNKRKYIKERIAPEVDRYIAEKIVTNRALGELNHPASPEVNPERAAIKIVGLTESGNDYVGKAKVLENLPMGNIVAGLIKEGVQLGVSSRGLGTLITNPKTSISEVADDFRLMTAADVVSDPSAPDALITAVMENKEWIWESGKLIEKEGEIQKMINTLSKRKKLNEDALVRVFQYILQQV